MIPQGAAAPSFGTGYVYPPVIGLKIWIGPLMTFGFATGFAFGLAADHGWGCSPWWGPWHGGWGATTININRNWNNINVNHQNIYNRWGHSVHISNNHIMDNNIHNDVNHWNNAHPQAANRDSQAYHNAEANHDLATTEHRETTSPDRAAIENNHANLHENTDFLTYKCNGLGKREFFFA